jgi:7-keto-8-aminopelargonate synthetase-like enzyme
MVADAEAKRSMMLTADRYTGRFVELEGKVLRSFGTCSYLGLDHRAEIREAAAQAALDFGTQFSISRAYLKCHLYEELEASLAAMTDRPVLVAASTTLAHLAAIPALVRDRDVVLIDQFAHASLHMATQLLHEVPVRLLRHSRLEQLESALEELAPQHERIWLLIDGLYSMGGDFAPFAELRELLERWPQLSLYIDDAHSTGWFGRHGRGAALTALGDHARVTVALSLNKSFAAAGGALALPDEETKARVRRCGGPMLFSGPIQPPMLGAALASAKIHLSDEHPQAQDELVKRIDYARRVANSLGLPLAAQQQTPIFFVPFGSIDEATDEARRLMDAGFHVCPSGFPAVPINRSGVRFTITLHNELSDIDLLIRNMVDQVKGNAIALTQERMVAS